jgi:octaprenyl-diphosphate synthase
LRMDYLSIIKRPIKQEFEDFSQLFASSLTYGDGLLNEVLGYIRQRAGKRMRPMLILLVAKAFGEVTRVSQYAAVGLELLHTASLVHDDVVDESEERRGQASVNSMYDNRVSVLVGDFILSTALLKISQTRNHRIVDYLATLGMTLSNGELLQLSNINNHDLSESVYYDVIKQKTAALFEACAATGALSSGAGDETVEKARLFGQNLGIAFQIRDDIFDYYDEGDIGKPTGNDMAEGKLTLPVLYALNSTKDKEFTDIAYKVKNGDVTKEEIARLVAFTKQNGGIEYAERRMQEYRNKALDFIKNEVKKPEIAESLTAYVDYVAARKL